MNKGEIKLKNIIMKRFTIVAGASLLALCIAGCSSDSPQDINPVEPPVDEPVDNPVEEDPVIERTPYKAIEMDSKTRSGVGVNNTFAFSLWSNLQKNARNDENITVVPYSVFSVLSMMANGDDGETRDEVLRTLGLESGEAGLAALNNYNRVMLSELPDLDGQVQISLANSLWLNEGLKINPTFANTIGTSYDGALNTCPLASEGMDRINAWVSDRTHGLIPNLLRQPLAGSELVVVNAFYFNGLWFFPFMEEATEQGDFTNADGSRSKADFMKLQKTFGYVRTDRMEMVSMKYGSGNYEMVLFMAGDTAVGEADINAALEARKDTETIITLPRFSQESSFELLDILKAMGMNRVNFNAMLEGGGTTLGRIVHAARIYVDEKGSRAAAGTAGELYGWNGEEVKPVEITFNRPFRFMIRETSTGTILLMGRVAKL